MATTFKSFGSSSVGTTPTTVYTAGAGITTTVVGLSLSNTSMANVNVSVELVKSGTGYFIVKGAPIPTGGSLVVVGGDQKLVVETGNSIRVTSSVVTSIDVITSVLELN